MASRYKEFLAQKAQKRAAAIAEATRLAVGGDYAEAERLIKSVDDAIGGVGAIAGMYRELLKAMVVPGGGRQSAEVERVFRRALDWAQRGYPDPHTRLEADDFERGRAEDLAQLVAILGYDPSGETPGRG